MSEEPQFVGLSVGASVDVGSVQEGGDLVDLVPGSQRAAGARGGAAADELETPNSVAPEETVLWRHFDGQAVGVLQKENTLQT